MKKLLLVVAFPILIILAVPSVVNAHQNGCHRWHSCPSDTGSYACGDLGYYTYCGSQSYYSEPDYAAEGNEKGRDHADNDSYTIEDQAATHGQEQGYQDGNSGSPEASSPDAGAVCDKQFTFDGYAPQNYQDAYHESYRERCTEIFDDAFDTAYAEGYKSGEEAYVLAANETTEGDSTENSDDSGSYSWIWWTLGIIGVLYFMGKRA